MNEGSGPQGGHDGPVEAGMMHPTFSSVAATIFVGIDQSGAVSKHYDLSVPKAAQFVANSKFSWVDQTVTDMDEAYAVAAQFGFSRTLIGSLHGGSDSAYLDRETEMGLKIPSVRVFYIEPVIEPIFFLIRDKLILTIHGIDCPRLVHFSRYADAFLRKQAASMPLVERRTLMLVRLMDENLNDHFDQLRYIEDHADKVSAELADMATEIRQVGDKIFQVKHATIVYLGTLWRTLDVVNSLRFGDAELIDDNQRSLVRLNMMIDDINRQLELAENMSDVLVSGMRVLQALHNNQMLTTNNKMVLVLTWMTLFGTAILVPNTLATIMGYAFAVEPLLLVWSLVVMIIATSTMSYLAFWWIRNWMNMPESPDQYLA